MIEQERPQPQAANDRGWRLAMGLWFYLGCAVGLLVQYLGWATGPFGLGPGVSVAVTLLIVAVSVLVLALLPFVVLAPFAYLLIAGRERRRIMRQLGGTAHLLAFLTGLSLSASLQAIVSLVMR